MAPAFLLLGQSLDECARRYRWFCHNYQPQAKAPGHGIGKRVCPWVRIQLAELTRLPRRGAQIPGQASLFADLEEYQVQKQENGQQSSLLPAILAVNHQFLQANCSTWAQSVYPTGTM